MKTFIYILLGIISAILTFKFGVSAFRLLISFEIVSSIVDIFVTCGLGLLTVKIFQEI